MKEKNKESTVITVSSKLENFKEAIEDLSIVVKEIANKVELKEGLKILMSVDINNRNHAHFNIYVNRKVDSDIEKTWKHGYSYHDQYEMSDPSQFIKYMCLYDL